MGFEEWYKKETNDDGHDDFWTKAGLEGAWNAAIAEAVEMTCCNCEGDTCEVHRKLKELNRSTECRHGESMEGCCNACADSGNDPRNGPTSA